MALCFNKIIKEMKVSLAGDDRTQLRSEDASQNEEIYDAEVNIVPR